MSADPRDLLLGDALEVILDARQALSDHCVARFDYGNARILAERIHEHLTAAGVSKGTGSSGLSPSPTTIEETETSAANLNHGGER